MVRHIVIWKLKEFGLGRSREDNIIDFKQLLLGLEGKIPGLLNIEVGLKSYCSAEDNADVVLIAEFQDWESLDIYQKHPEHQKVSNYAKKIVENRTVIDYITDIEKI